MEFEGKEIPREICQALADRVDLLDKKTLLHYAGRFSIKGVRLIEKNAGKFRDTFRRRILKSAKATGLLTELIEDIVVTTGCFGVLSTKALTDFADYWLGFFGEADTLGCWLFDKRDSVRRMALKRLSNFPDAKIMSHEHAREIIRKDFSGFLNQIKPLISEEDNLVPTPAAKQDIPQDALYGDQLKELRDLAGKSRGLQKKLDKTATTVNELTAEIKLTKEMLTENERKNAELDKVNSNLAKLLDEERKARFIKISDAVQQRLMAEENRWLREFRELEKKFVPPQADSLLDKAESILHHQAQIDTLYGNRTLLEKELERLDGMRQKVHRARLDSLHPLNELNQIEEELERLCREISEKLGSKSDFRVPTAFLNEIEKAETLDDFSRCRQRLRDAVAAEFVDPTLGGEIEKYIHRREMTLYIRKLGPRDIIPAGLSGVEKLRAEIEKQEPLKVWLDGHNIINSLERFRKMSDAGAEHKFLRDELINILLPIVRKSPKAEWVLVFDSAYPSNEHFREKNFSVRYSGGGSRSQRADNLISGEISYEFSEASAMSRFVFTNDRTLANEVKSMGATVLPCDDLEILTHH